MYHIAATLHMTVAELDSKLSYTEYLGWLEYFQSTQQEQGPKNLLDNPNDLLKGFGF